MRHRVANKTLNMTSPHRKAMFVNMSASLIKHEAIKTTLTRAKELRRVVEPLITLARTDNLANRRRAYAYLRDKEAVSKLFDTLAQRYKERPGGYMRVLKYGYRQGDKVPMAFVELVDRPITEDNEPEAKDTSKDRAESAAT